MPAESRAQVEAERDAGDRGQREGRHQRARGPAPPLLGEDVADDRQRHPAEDAAERAGDDPGRQQRRVARRQPAEQRPDQEARVEVEEGRLRPKRSMTDEATSPATPAPNV